MNIIPFYNVPTMRKVGHMMVSSSSLFILINLFVHGINFIRSMVFMRVMDMAELGLISLVQTCMMFIGLLQFGFLNGGYRIFAYKQDSDQIQVNNIIFSFFGVIALVLLITWGLIYMLNVKLIIHNQYLFYTFLAGIFSLMATWLTNTMTVKKMIPEINTVNLISGLLSVTFIPLVYAFGIMGGIISILTQPLAFVLLSLLRYKSLRPSKLCWDKKVVMNILSLGFVPFLVGIFTILNIQIERWSIAYLLNVQDLGRFYLVFLFSSLFILIPTSINYLFFPKIIYFYEKGLMSEFVGQIRKFTWVLVAYGAVVTVAVLTLLQPVVDCWFPAHSVNTHYVFLLVPGLMAQLLYYSVSAILNAWKDFTSLLVSGLIGIVAAVVIIAVSSSMNRFSLTVMVYIKNISYFLPALFGAAYIFINRRKFRHKHE